MELLNSFISAFVAIVAVIMFASPILLFFLLISLIIVLFTIMIIVPIVICVILTIRTYKKTSYYAANPIPYSVMRNDSGRYGEYLIYKSLKSFEKSGTRFLFNVYVPKTDGTTTEIDILAITPYGLISFESKNYSGWIFGTEDKLEWYQILPRGRRKSNKEVFYNPIMQNQNHIKHLKQYMDSDIPIQSIIVFSDRCTFKDLKLSSNDNIITKTSEVFLIFDNYCKNSTVKFNEEEIDRIYALLFPLTQVSEEEKMKHIANIQNKGYSYQNEKEKMVQKNIDKTLKITKRILHKKRRRRFRF